MFLSGNISTPFEVGSQKFESDIMPPIRSIFDVDEYDQESIAIFKDYCLISSATRMNSSEAGPYAHNATQWKGRGVGNSNLPVC